MRDDGYFGEPIAKHYDDSIPERYDPGELKPTVDFLAGLAAGGRALEFGIGTGRVALPLAERGIPVHGIEMSQAMADRLCAKPQAERIEIHLGNFAEVRVEGTFRLVFLVFNTIMNLTSPSEQVAGFRNAAAHLELGGRFVIEVVLPDLQRLPFGETIRPFELSETHWGFDEYDLPSQGVVSHHLFLGPEGVERFSVPLRYVWPAELDLMAEMAGLRLRERWGGWQREPFTKLSERHVSVWEMPG